MELHFSDMSKEPTIPLGIRMIARMLQSRLGRVRAMERALRLQGVVRFTLLTLSLIIAPSLFLAYFGVSSIRSQESSVQAELGATSNRISRSFLDGASLEFSSFASVVRYLLEAGKPPFGDLHINQRIALRFDRDQKLIAPFVDARLPETSSHYFHPAAMSAQTLPSGAVLPDRVQAVLEAEQHIGGTLAMNPQKLQERDFHGSRLDLLLGLRSIRGLSNAKARKELLRIAESVLGSPWSLRSEMEGAIAYRALAQLQQLQGAGEEIGQARLDSLRTQLEERMRYLYWAVTLEEEWRDILRMSRQTRSGDLLWQVGQEGIWARTKWGDDTYIFGIDKDALISKFQKMAREASQNDPRLSMKLLPPGTSEPEAMLARRFLPFLEGWSIAVFLRDPAAFKQQQDRAMLQRMGLVGLAVLAMTFGLILSVRVAANEIEVATVKSDFAASVSHELRSPITQIRLRGESLLFGLADTEEEKMEHYEAVVRESERLSWLVDNVLDYASIERGAKHYIFRANDLQETVDRAVQSMESTLTMRDVVIDLSLHSSLPPIRHDPDAVSQCMINLLSNAVKYSDAEKWIGLSVRRVASGVDIVVSDRGIGIQPIDFKRIFEPFYRSTEGAARSRKGTGIGLAITKYIMEAHGGKVIVQSRFGEGSTFILHFPFDLIDIEGADEIG
jgi:signal transduction histidine kinase